MDAARLKRARRRMRSNWIGGGLVGSIVFLALAALIVRLAGADRASSLTTITMGAMVLALGSYAIFFFGSVLFHIAKRVWNRQPITERED